MRTELRPSETLEIKKKNFLSEGSYLIGGTRQT